MSFFIKNKSERYSTSSNKIREHIRLIKRMGGLQICARVERFRHNVFK